MLNYINAFVEGFNRFFSREGRPHLSKNNIVLVRDEDVHYDTWTLNESSLITLDRFEEVFSSEISYGPFWIHANLIPIESDGYLITISMGKGEGCCQPRIDLSIERNKIIKIISLNKNENSNPDIGQRKLGKHKCIK